jgi:hypothetical protein
MLNGAGAVSTRPSAGVRLRTSLTFFSFSQQACLKRR